jgi:predicted DnaQ family exonuclease/DinG family helicase
MVRFSNHELDGAPRDHQAEWFFESLRKSGRAKLSLPCQLSVACYDGRELAPDYVAFDLETTGLDIERDSIIEFGAVRFSRDGVIDTYQTLVNPRSSLPAPVQMLTGLRDEDLRDAPPVEVVAADFERFIAGSVLVGHNICGFDLPVLDAQGIRRPDAAYDTQRIAFIVMPALGQYGLADLVDHFAIDFPVHHRALADAEAARSIFLAMLDKSLELPAEVLGQIAQWLTPTAFPWRGFFRDAWEIAATRPPAKRSMIREPAERDLRSLKPRQDAAPVAVEQPLAVLAVAALRPDVFEQFEERAEQRQMLEAVCCALNDGARFMVEAGTGTGKSLAYLIPAACQAAASGGRVVVSTSTINLQEQLTRKDIPAVQALMPDAGVLACQLKGRRNYLCLRRFEALRNGPGLSDDEAYLASRVLVWLGETETGDRGELRLSPEEEALWWRISADRAECTSDNSPFVVDGKCFLLRARRRAEASHVVVVNHALLLSDIGTGGRVVPPYEHVIIDEAHHLEDEATRQFGFNCREKDLETLLDRCEAIVPALQNALRTAPVALDARQQIASIAAGLPEAARSARPRVRELCGLLAAFLTDHSLLGEEQKLHVTPSTRVQPDWSGVEIAWENCRLTLNEVAGRLGKLDERLSDAEQVGMLNQELIVGDVGRCLEDAQGYLAGLAQGLESDDPQRIVWLEADRQGGGVIVSWVPLSVNDLLREGLYAERKTVILTGATLRSQGGFAYLQSRLGLDDCQTLALGSPFDYRRAALVLCPRDMPDPQSPVFIDHASQTIIDLVRASRGRALVLFTSHAMLRAAHRIISARLQEEGITVLGQGISGSPRQLVRMLRSSPASVILGTSSFWEGVDIPGDTLSLLVIARLPFAVPTDPVYAARAALYEDSFSQFALPQAVIRFKQGFGRLIRSRTDRGVLVVLDPRIVAKQYGASFLQALPPCPIKQVPVRQMADEIAAWLSRPRADSPSPAASPAAVGDAGA